MEPLPGSWITSLPLAPGLCLLSPLCWKHSPVHPVPAPVCSLSHSPLLSFALGSCFSWTDSCPGSTAPAGMVPVRGSLSPSGPEHLKDEGECPGVCRGAGTWRVLNRYLYNYEYILLRKHQTFYFQSQPQKHQFWTYKHGLKLFQNESLNLDLRILWSTPAKDQQEKLRCRPNLLGRFTIHRFAHGLLRMHSRSAGLLWSDARIPCTRLHAPLSKLINNVGGNTNYPYECERPPLVCLCVPTRPCLACGIPHHLPGRRWAPPLYVKPAAGSLCSRINYYCKGHHKA